MPRTSSRIASFAAGTAISLLAYAASPAIASSSVVSSPEEAEEALRSLSPEQDAAWLQALASAFSELDFSSALGAFGQNPDSALDLGLGPWLLQQLSLSSTNASLPVDLLGLLPSALSFEWQTESGGVTRSHSATLNVPSLLDVDGSPGADVIATLAISGTSGVTLSVDRVGTFGGLGLKLATVPLKIEAIVADPRGSATQFAFGYDARATEAPSSFSETISIAGSGGNTTISIDVSQSGAVDQLKLIAEEFRGSASNRSPEQTIGVGLTPVPATVHAAVTLGDSIGVDLGAASPTTATVNYVRHATGGPQPVAVTIGQLPTNLAINVAKVGDRTELTYAATSRIDVITALAEELSGFGSAKVLSLTLGDVPTNMSLNLGGDGQSFDLNTNGADLGLLEAALSSGAIEALPSQYDGVLLKDVPGLSLISARISGLRRVSGNQEPLSILLDSTAGRAFKVELRDKPSATAQETYTLATLSALARNTQVSISDGSQQRINYSAASSTGSLSFATNAGSRNYMNADIAPVPSSIAICAAGNNSCSTSGKAGNTASFRIVTNQHMNVNLFDCQNGSCSEQLRLSNVNIRHVDFTVNVGKNCPWYGCWPNGSKGSIWLDTDNHALRGTILSQSSSFKVKAGFGNNFRSNNRYVTWSYFVPSKSGSISCTSGTYLDVTVFGITIDVSGLYLC